MCSLDFLSSLESGIEPILVIASIEAFTVAIPVVTSDSYNDVQRSVKKVVRA